MIRLGIKQILELLSAIKELMERLILANQKPDLVKQEVSDEWLTVTQVRFMLDVGTKSLYNYVKQGKLISRKRSGTNIYLKSSVTSFMEG